MIRSSLLLAGSFLGTFFEKKEPKKLLAMKNFPFGFLGVSDPFSQKGSEKRFRGVNMYYTYIIRCAGGSLYTGIAKNMFSRMKEHAGKKTKSAKYTKSHQVIALEALWSSSDRSAASRLEYAIKTLKKAEKEALIRDPRLLTKFLPKIEKEDYIHHSKASLSLFLGEIRLSDLL